MTEQNNKPLTPEQKYQEEQRIKLEREGKKFDRELKIVYSVIIGFILAVIIGVSACTMNMLHDINGDSGCNDSYIEQDYNGDGEQDAEDFRIQTEAC